MTRTVSGCAQTVVGYVRTPCRNFYLVDESWRLEDGTLQGTMVPNWPTDGVYPPPRWTIVSGTWAYEEIPGGQEIVTELSDTQGGHK